jgi:DNA modification methylase
MTTPTVWDIEQPRKNEHHPTQKPVECMARPIRNHGDKEDDVYDPFLGSGTTIIAAEQLNRRCYGLEIDPRYCDVICQRYQKLTGKPAILEATGQKFDEVSIKRGDLTLSAGSKTNGKAKCETSRKSSPKRKKAASAR